MCVQKKSKEKSEVSFGARLRGEKGDRVKEKEREKERRTQRTGIMAALMMQKTR